MTKPLSPEANGQKPALRSCGTRPVTKASPPASKDPAHSSCETLIHTFKKGIKSGDNEPLTCSQLGVTGCEPVPAARAQVGTHPGQATLSSQDHSRWPPRHLPRTSLGDGRKPQAPEKTHADQGGGGRAHSSQTGPAGKRFLIDVTSDIRGAGTRGPAAWVTEAPCVVRLPCSSAPDACRLSPATIP